MLSIRLNQEVVVNILFGGIFNRFTANKHMEVLDFSAIFAITPLLFDEKHIIEANDMLRSPKFL
jgi:hypothetical protein